MRIIYKKARYEFTLTENLEVGLVLHSPEVKSIINGGCNLKGSYVKIINNEVFLLNCHINTLEYREKWRHNIEEDYENRPKKLLLHKREIVKFKKLLQTPGTTLILYDVYTDKNGKIKGTLCLAKGKKLHDKRNTIKERDLSRETKIN